VERKKHPRIKGAGVLRIMSVKQNLQNTYACDVCR
jgi:hypothetical protein